MMDGGKLECDDLNEEIHYGEPHYNKMLKKMTKKVRCMAM